MTPELILALLQGVLGAAPQLLALFNRAASGTPVSHSDVAAVLSQYGIDRAVFAAAIAKADAAAGTGQTATSGSQITTFP